MDSVVSAPVLLLPWGGLFVSEAEERKNDGQWAEEKEVVASFTEKTKKKKKSQMSMPASMAI